MSNRFVLLSILYAFLLATFLGCAGQRQPSQGQAYHAAAQAGLQRADAGVGRSLTYSERIQDKATRAIRYLQ